jgi:Rap1a immunity proteins
MTRALVVVLLCCAMLFLVVESGRAQSVRFEQYQNPKDETDRIFNRLFLAGVKDGLEAYAVFVEHENGVALFCIPSKLALTTEQAADIMSRWVKDHPTVDAKKLFVSQALLLGLQETFPCKK